MTFVQRLGSAANLNLYCHLVALDGVFAEMRHGTLSFHRAAPPDADHIAALLRTIRERVLRHLGKRGLVDDDCGDTDPFSDAALLLAGCYASSIQQRKTLGEQRGAPLQRFGCDRDAVRVE